MEAQAQSNPETVTVHIRCNKVIEFDEDVQMTLDEWETLKEARYDLDSPWEPNPLLQWILNGDFEPIDITDVELETTIWDDDHPFGRFEMICNGELEVEDDQEDE